MISPLYGPLVVNAILIIAFLGILTGRILDGGRSFSFFGTALCALVRNSVSHLATSQDANGIRPILNSPLKKVGFTTKGTKHTKNDR